MPAWAAYDPTGQRPRVLALAQHRHAIDKNMLHPRRILMRLGKSGVVLDRLRIKYHNISEMAGQQTAAPRYLKCICRQRRQAPNRLRQADDLFFTDIFAQEAGEAAIGARVRDWTSEKRLPEPVSLSRSRS